VAAPRTSRVVMPVSDFAIRIANSPRLLLSTAMVLLTISSVGYSIAEGENILTGFWWSVVTATTVGYGDAYPRTVAGKFTAGMLMASMVLFFIPMVTASFASRLIVNRDAFTHDEQEQIKEGISEILRRLDDEGR
jgi:voltage-gated potassium channel